MRLKINSLLKQLRAFYCKFFLSVLEYAEKFTQETKRMLAFVSVETTQSDLAIKLCELKSTMPQRFAIVL